MRTPPPPPRGISEEAQRALAGTGSPERPFPPAHETEAWLALVASVEGWLRPGYKAAVPSAETFVLSEFACGESAVYALRPTHIEDSPQAPLYLDIHGGGFFVGGGELAWMTAVSRASRIMVVGGSAGANLGAAMLLRAKDEGLPMPAGLVMLSPAIDLTESGDTFSTNLGIDTVLPSIMPVFLQSGTRDLLLSNTVRMHRRLLAAGVPTELHIFEAMPHGSFGGRAPEDHDLATEIRRFESEHLA